MTQAKVSRITRGLDVATTLTRLSAQVDAELHRGDARRLWALRAVLSAGVKVGLRQARARDYALAHNAVLEWVSALPREHGEAPPFPAEAAFLASHPVHAPLRLRDVFAGSVGVLLDAGLSARECAQLVDDGWGGPTIERIRRVRRQGKRAGPDSWSFLERALRNVKGDCGTCRSAHMDVASAAVAHEDAGRGDDRDDDRQTDADRGSCERASDACGDNSLVDSHGQAPRASAWPVAAGTPKLHRGALVAAEGEAVVSKCDVAPSRRSERTRSKAGRRGPSKVGAVKR